MRAEFDLVPDIYAPKPGEVAGFDLYGERQDDGSIKLGTASTIPEVPDNRTHLPAFPDNVEVLGRVYTLEFIRGNDEGEWAKTAPVDDPRRRICWGVYV